MDIGWVFWNVFCCMYALCISPYRSSHESAGVAFVQMHSLGPAVRKLELVGSNVRLCSIELGSSKLYRVDGVSLATRCQHLIKWRSVPRAPCPGAGVHRSCALTDYADTAVRVRLLCTRSPSAVQCAPVASPGLLARCKLQPQIGATCGFCNSLKPAISLRCQQGA